MANSCESLLALPMHETALVMPFLVHSTIIATSALINQGGSYHHCYYTQPRLCLDQSHVTGYN